MAEIELGRRFGQAGGSHVGYSRQVSVSMRRSQLDTRKYRPRVRWIQTIERMEVAMRRLFIGLVTSLLLLLPAMAADEVPDGTIELSGGSVAVGIGYSWGSGKLVFQGKTYPLKVQGVSIVDVGASDYTATGSVHNLKRLEDFAGNYTAATAGATVAAGASATILKNQNGVIIKLSATRQGLQFTLAPEGIKISLAN